MDDSTDAEGTEVTMGELREIVEASRLRIAPSESSEAKRFGGELEDRGWGIERFQSLSGPPEAQLSSLLKRIKRAEALRNGHRRVIQKRRRNEAEAQAVAALLKLEAEVVETLLPARDDDGGDHIMR